MFKFQVINPLPGLYSMSCGIAINDVQFNLTRLLDIDVTKYNEIFQLIEKIGGNLYSQTTTFDNNNKSFIFYIPPVDEFVIFNQDYKALFFCHKNRKSLIIHKFTQFVEPSAEKIKTFNLLGWDAYEKHYETTSHRVPKIDIANFHKNYPKNFPHNDILNCFNKDKGIILFHGLPGTGKTTYIRYLMHKLDKKILYIPASNITDIAKPEFVQVLIENKDSVVVIEDAEKCLVKRDKDSLSVVTTILNLSDGLLSDIFNFQLLATFNTNISNIDEAILRKGRLVGRFEFKPLSKEEAQAINPLITTEATLADIYG